MDSSPGDAPRDTTNAAVVQDHEVRDKDVRKIAMSAFVGTALEWYDFFLFGTASALVFNHLYFATDDPVTATLASFATFGVGFLHARLERFFLASSAINMVVNPRCY